MGLYNPELCVSAIGSRVPGREGIRVREAGLPYEIRCCSILGAPRSWSDCPGTKIQFPLGKGTAAKTGRYDKEVVGLVEQRSLRSWVRCLYTGLWVALGMANFNTYLNSPLQVSPQINKWVQP